jgi:hypothetical protein
VKTIVLRILSAQIFESEKVPGSCEAGAEEVQFAYVQLKQMGLIQPIPAWPRCAVSGKDHSSVTFGIKNISCLPVLSLSLASMSVLQISFVGNK